MTTKQLYTDNLELKLSEAVLASLSVLFLDALCVVVIIGLRILLSILKYLREAAGKG